MIEYFFKFVQSAMVYLRRILSIGLYLLSNIWLYINNMYEQILVDE